MRRDPHRPKSQAWWADHTHAKTVDCVGWPKGCDAGVSQPCVAPDGQPLSMRPAHEARLAKARTDHPQTLPVTTEETSP